MARAPGVSLATVLVQSLCAQQAPCTAEAIEGCGEVTRVPSWDVWPNTAAPSLAHVALVARWLMASPSLSPRATQAPSGHPEAVFGEQENVLLWGAGGTRWPALS